MNKLGPHYWNQRYQTGQTGWNIAGVSPAFEAWVASRSDLDAPTLIPGCGHAHEALYLLSRGFTNLHLLDLSDQLIHSLEIPLREYIQAGKVTLHCQDFFTFHGSFEWIFEQTFFCALPPSLRPAYARHMHQLLTPTGKLVGLLFHRTFPNPGPPFGGSLDEYRALFEPAFEFQHFAPTNLSIPPRQGSELWMELIKK